MIITSVKHQEETCAVAQWKEFCAVTRRKLFFNSVHILMYSCHEISPCDFALVIDNTCNVMMQWLQVWTHTYATNCVATLHKLLACHCLTPLVRSWNNDKWRVKRFGAKHSILSTQHTQPISIFTLLISLKIILSIVVLPQSVAIVCRLSTFQTKTFRNSMLALKLFE